MRLDGLLQLAKTNTNVLVFLRSSSAPTGARGQKAGTWGLFLSSGAHCPCDTSNRWLLVVAMPRGHHLSTRFEDLDVDCIGAIADRLWPLELLFFHPVCKATRAAVIAQGRIAVRGLFSLNHRTIAFRS